MLPSFNVKIMHSIGRKIPGFYEFVMCKLAQTQTEKKRPCSFFVLLGVKSFEMKFTHFFSLSFCVAMLNCLKTGTMTIQIERFVSAKMREKNALHARIIKTLNLNCGFNVTTHYAKIIIDQHQEITNEFYITFNWC